MSLLVETVRREIKTLMENDIRLSAIGDLEQLHPKTLTALKEGMEKTKENERMVLTLALNYSGRWDILQASKRLANDAKSGKIDSQSIDENLFSSYLSTAQMPDPDFLIRTSGEHRLSNFLLWELSYAEFYFTDVFWPAFSKDEFYRAILDFQNRERRFGKISEQLSTQIKI